MLWIVFWILLLLWIVSIVIGAVSMAASNLLLIGACGVGLLRLIKDSSRFE